MEEKALEAASAVIRSAAAKYEGGFVTREVVKEMTCGVMKPAYLAILDSRGQGIPGAFKIGRKQCYPVAEVVTWLISRITN